jgi:hypothetical protein
VDPYDVENPQERDFAQFPIWADVDDDLYRPVEGVVTLPEDMGQLLVRALFVTPAGTNIDGYVALGRGRVYAIGLFLKSREVGFNINLSDLAEEKFKSLQKALPTAQARSKAMVFPIRYATGFKRANGEELAGIFDPFPQGESVVRSTKKWWIFW